MLNVFDLGRDCGAERVTGNRGTGGLRARARRALRTMRRWNRRFQSGEGQAELPAVRWMLENDFLCRREGRNALGELRQIGGLPRLARGGGRGVPAFYEALLRLGEETGGRLTREELGSFLRGLQTMRPFASRELFSLPILLRLVVLELLAGLCPEAQNGEKQDVIAKRMEGCFSTLRLLTTFDCDAFLAEVSETELILARDPGGIYPQMEERSKAYYRRLLELQAKKKGISEVREAREALLWAQSKGEGQHLGAYLLKEKPKLAGKVYIAAICVLTLLLTAALAFLTGAWALLALLPLWQGVKLCMDALFLKRRAPDYVVRLELPALPENGRTLVAISCLLTDEKSIAELAARGERFFLANRDEKLTVALLLDYRDSACLEEDGDAALREAVRARIVVLNRTYGEHFAFFLRRRTYYPRQDCYMGWERKRGAILHLVRFIKGTGDFDFFEGNRAELSKINYVLALDSDTSLPMGAVRELVGAMLHPQNRPVLGENGRIIRGYGLLQPRMGVNLQSAAVSLFASFMAGHGGIDHYANTAGDVYQDLFGTSVFCGKGMFDVDCYDRVIDQLFPENKILSHDLLEGAFLRTGLISDVEFCDGCPSGVLPYFQRQHRWVRGDVQTLPYLGRTLRNTKGEKLKNPLSFLTKWQIADNLKTALAPAFALAFLLLCAFGQGIIPWVGLFGYLGFLWAPLLISAAGTFLSGNPAAVARRYYSQALPGSRGAALRMAYLAASALFSARMGLDAVLRAFYRMLISKRKLLSWVTAAESEQSKGSLRAYGRAMLPELLLGGAIAWLVPFWPVKLLGILWALSFALGERVSRKRKKPAAEQDCGDRRYLLELCEEMWGFYRDGMNEENSYLPPDNLQETPVYAVARRTSPTNLGLGLLCVLAARDFSFITTRELYERLQATITTMEGMETLKGHFYNWYRTDSPTVMKPAYVSSVDSGNLAACLITLLEGVGQYSFEYPALASLLPRLRRLLDRMEFQALYDPRRRLFHIGCDGESGELSEGCYDLLMSEARILSYVAIGRGAVAPRHWFALQRTAVRRRGYTGLASWSGTMFEYFMPRIFLPTYENSLIGEALRFALACQKEWAAKQGVPYGISESGFYAFDSALNYQYRAFGVPKLALKRETGEETVVSPYSSFLALGMDETALDNLRRLERLGARGRYGFYEAVDFTRGPKRGAVVQSYMAHHVGMSLLMCDNLLCKDAMSARFLANPRMGCAAELLQERLLKNAPSLRCAPREAPLGRNRGGAREETVRLEDGALDVHRMRGMVLAGEKSRLEITDFGYSHATFDGRMPYRFRGERLCNPKGFFMAVRAGKTKLPCTVAPVFDQSASYRAELSLGHVCHSAEKEHLAVTVTTLLHPTVCAQVREVLLRCDQAEASWEGLCYCEPSLAAFEDDLAHPAFQNLFMEASFEGGILYFSRRSKDGSGHRYLALGVQGSGGITSFEVMGQKLEEGFQTGDLLSLFDRSFSCAAGALITPVCAVKIGGAFSRDGLAAFRVTLVYGETKEGCGEQLRALGRESFGELLSLGEAVSLGRKKAAGAVNLRALCSVVPALRFGCGARDLRAAAENVQGQQALWRFSLSGDLPILLFRADSEEDCGFFREKLPLMRYLTLCGVPLEGIVLYSEGGDYGRPLYRRLHTLAEQAGCAVQWADRRSISREDAALLEAACAVCFSKNQKRPPGGPSWRELRLPIKETIHETAEPVTLGERSVCIRKGISKNPWSNVLTNGRFGTVLTDGSLGYTFAFNARENKLTPWTNDLLDPGGEFLFFLRDGKRLDLCKACGETEFGAGYGRYSGRVDGAEVEVTVFIPVNLAAKIITVAVKGGKGGAVSYGFRPVLGAGAEDSRFVTGELRGDVFFFKNPYAPHYHGTGFLFCDCKAQLGCSAVAFYAGAEGGETLPQDEPFLSLSVSLAGDTVCSFVLGYGASETELAYTLDALHKRGIPALRAESLAWNEELAGRVKAKTGNRGIDTLCSFYLPYQTMASRLLARTGLYQCGGAFGYRDQLQDARSLLLTAPMVLKRQLLRCAAHQFAEGDVQHWWHNLPTEQGWGHPGVRTRCSDDLLWLPFGVANYVAGTGDTAFLETKLAYLVGEELAGGDDAYFRPQKTKEKQSVYDHCKRALERAYRLGCHGLPLIWGGDWNDGMNEVGSETEGESVWLAMFFILAMRGFARLALLREPAFAETLTKRADAMERAVGEFGWDGDWYLRGYYSDGGKIGSKESEECRLDLLSQAFAPLVCPGETERNRRALQSVWEQLCDFDVGLLKLFTPPFDQTERKPGYIKGYVPGIRENGGQYTHGAIWAAMGFFALGDGDRGFRLLELLCPFEKAQSIASLERYRNEPYVLSADIYANPAHYGQGGWSWYTGAAAWYETVLLEHCLGLGLSGGKLTVAPCLPAEMAGYQLEIRLLGKGTYTILAKRGEPRCLLDGAPASFPLAIQEGNHRLEVYFQAGL